MSSNTLPNDGKADERQSSFFAHDDAWRSEIAQRVAAHKARAGGAISSDPIPAAATSSPTRARAVSQRALESVRRRMEERAAREEAECREREELALFFAETERNLITAPAAPVTVSKLIEFPRTATLRTTVAEPEAADLLPDQLTIFEEKEEMEEIDPRAWHFHPVRPVFSALRLDEPADFAIGPETEPRREQLFDLPLKVAPFTLRATAALIDLTIVLGCALMFAATFYGIYHQVPHGKSAFISAMLVSWMLWTIYQFLFLAYTEGTPGLRLTRLGISDFEDRVPSTRMRVARAGALVLGSLSCGLGFVWVLLDEDRLAWHDRMTRTFPRQLA